MQEKTSENLEIDFDIAQVEAIGDWSKMRKEACNYLVTVFDAQYLQASVEVETLSLPIQRTH